MADLKADLLLVTVTKGETKAVLQAFHEATGEEASRVSVGRKTVYDLRTVDGTRVALVRSEPGTAALGSAIQTVQKGIEAVRPSAVVMVGIAFGVDEEKQAIGDVLVSKQLVAYEPQRVGTSGSIPRGSRVDCSPWLLGRCRDVELDWGRSAVRIGRVLSGEKLVDDLDFRQRLVEQEPEAVGGEMEGAGLYAACQDARVDWVLVKAICDWADGEKATDKKRRQTLAAENAAAFVLDMLAVGPLAAEPRPEPTPAPRFDRVGVAGAVTVAGDLHATTVSGAEPEKEPPYSTIPTLPYFFGRVEELQTVTGAVHPDARTWGALIDGPGGIGKTALAIRAAHDAPREHFDRKIFLSAKVRELRPTGEVPLDDFVLPSFLDLLTELARALGEGHLSKTAEKDRAAAVRRVLGDRRALLVIDNLETLPSDERDRLFQFLERLPPGCKAIVTSRRRTDIDARIVRLGRMKEAEALQLLDALAETRPLLAKATEDERRQLYEATGGNPLLLRWTVGQLGRPQSRCRTVAAAIDFLHAAPRGNDPLAYVFGDLLDTFTEAEEAVLAALSHFSRPARTAWVADLARLSEMQAQTALEDLTDRALVTGDPEEREFVLPPLAATFIRRERPDTVAQTGDRLEDHAYALALENGGQQFDRFPTLDAEWPLIQAALPRFLRKAREETTTGATERPTDTDDPFQDSPFFDVDPPSANDRLQHLCDALDNFLDFSGRWDDRLWLVGQAEEIARSAEDYHNAGWRAYQAGYMYGLRRQADHVLACAERAEVHWKAAGGGTRERAIALHLRGLGHKIAEAYPAALDAYRKSLDITRSLDPESRDVAVGLANIADIDQLTGDLDASERTRREALRIASAAGAKDVVANQTGNLAGLALDRKDWTEAERLAQEALEKAEAIGRQELIGGNCHRLAEALLRQGRAEEAWPYAQRSVAIFEPLGHPDLGDAQVVLRECEEAIAASDSA